MSLRPWDEMQLRFDLPGLDEIEEDAQERKITPEQARQISEAARQALGGSGDLPDWFEDYLALMEHGWPWRVAAYIAWASTPKIGRQPDTLKEFAEQRLGLKSPRVISNWRRKYPSIDTIVARMQEKDLHEHRADVLRTLAQMASTPDYKMFNDRKLFLELTGDYVPRSQMQISGSAKDLSELSDEELDRLAGEDGLTTNNGDKEHRTNNTNDGEEEV